VTTLPPRVRQATPEASTESVIDRLSRDGIRVVRVTYSDLHGIARGKELPLEVFADAVDHGLAFCVANLTDGLASNVTDAPGLAPERGFPDMMIRPLVETLVPIPWEPATAWCLGTVTDVAGGSDQAPRCLLERAVAAFAELGLIPVIAVELEFYLLRSVEGGGYQRYADGHSMVYTVGGRADPLGVMRAMVDAASALGLEVTAANHEFGRGQFEINLVHGDALEATDRAFRFKAMVKEVAARHGLLATFVGKPFTDDAGSGLHVHLSCRDGEGRNLFDAPSEQRGVSRAARCVLAGILAHAPPLMAFLAPTINAYKRLAPGSLVPTSASWGYDNRTTFARIPAERGRATRVEIRAGDAAANPYLAVAATLAAGFDGLRRDMTLGPETMGDASLASAPCRLPRSLGEALDRLEADQILCDAIGAPLIRAFAAMKRIEIERFHTTVTDLERNEYFWHL